MNPDVKISTVIKVSNYILQHDKPAPTYIAHALRINYEAVQSVIAFLDAFKLIDKEPRKRGVRISFKPEVARRLTQ